MVDVEKQLPEDAGEELSNGSEMFEKVDPNQDLPQDEEGEELLNEEIDKLGEADGDLLGEKDLEDLNEDGDLPEGEDDPDRDDAEDDEEFPREEKVAEKQPATEGFVNAAMVGEIEQKEKELLGAKKHWQMTGEVVSHDRPVNSLVEETLDFQLATKMPLVHTVPYHEITVDVGREHSRPRGDDQAADPRRTLRRPHTSDCFRAGGREEEAGGQGRRNAQLREEQEGPVGAV